MSIPRDWLHPTKGWRGFSRPRGTNKRRKLITQGWLMIPGTREHNQWARETHQDRKWPQLAVPARLVLWHEG